MDGTKASKRHKLEEIVAELRHVDVLTGQGKRKKNDAADAEAICEVVNRPSMRFVAVKSADQQSVQVTLAPAPERTNILAASAW
jgi:transposase